jgi:enoyl-CoA hydratase
MNTITVEHKNKTVLITFNRPKVLNALNNTVMQELGEALKIADTDTTVHSIILTGSEKAFAAGADIAEMQHLGFVEAYLTNFITNAWEHLSTVRKPVIAAVSGFALGGGNEVAMMCDIVLASDTAKFGQPEITLGILPGAGGTQRLTRAVGKATAMDMCLTGRMITAEQALAAGLVSRIVPIANLLEEALKISDKLGSLSLPTLLMTKESINRAFETTLSEGIRFERRLFHASFATEDQKEGMAAFIEKRPPVFNNK